MRESTVAHGPEHGLERLIFFSDAVFAIAITLLVIEIQVPHLPHGSTDRDFCLALARLGPNFAGFFISFYVIGFFWAGHHRAMACASHYAPALTMPNLVLLSTVAAIPFFTAFASANPLQRVPIFCYCAWLFVTACCNRYLQGLATRPPVLSENASRETIVTVRRRGTAVVLGSATAALVSLFVPVLGQVALMSIPLWRLVLRKLGERGAAGRAREEGVL